MLQSNKHLTSSDLDQKVFDIPFILEVPDAITKMDYLTIYDSNYGTSDLSTVQEFNLSSENLDLFVHPHNSYLLVTVKLTKADGTDIPATDHVIIDSNAYNIFEQARYFIDDNEIEKIDEVGICTQLYHLTKYSYSEYHSIRDTQLLGSHEMNKKYQNATGNEIQLLLPVKKIFPFIGMVSHSFRGVKHRICLTKQHINKVVFKWKKEAGDAMPPNCKYTITNLIWKLPYYEPSLVIQAKLESLFAKKSVFDLEYIASNCYRIQPPKNIELRIPLSSTVHRPTNIFIMFQKLTRSTNQEHSFMRFDHMNVEMVSIEINGQTFPPKDITCQFTKPFKACESYKNFLEACYESAVFQESYHNYILEYPIHHIDVSKCKPSLYENSDFPNIVVKVKFDTIPTEDYVMYAVIYNIRSVTMNIDNRQMKIIK